MEQEKRAGMIRVRVFFDHHLVLNNTQLSDGNDRCWLLLKPSIATFGDLASHIREMFSLPHRLILCIGDFVLPPFESTCIIRGEDIIWVKKKNVKLEDAYKPCDIQDLVRSSQMAGTHNLALANRVIAVHKSKGLSQENLNNQNALHGDSLSLGILVPKKRKEHLLEVSSSIRKKQTRNNNIERQVTSIGIQPGADVDMGEQVLSSSMPCEGRQQPEEINQGFESELHTLYDVTKECDQMSCVTSQMNQNQLSKMTFERRNYHDSHEGESSGLDRKPEEESPDKKAKTAKHKINFSSIFPLTRSPLKGDILAYRYVEPSSTAYPELSSPQVGKVSAFNSESSVIVLVKAPEFEVFSEYDPLTNVSLERASYPYKEDGLLEIKLSALIDIRLLKAHDSMELACLPEGSLDRFKNNNWEVASERSNWNQSGSQYTVNKINNWDSWTPNDGTNARSWCGKGFIFPRGGESGGKSSTTEGRASSWFSGATPAEALFWETIFSRVPNGKGGKSSAPRKY